MLTYQNLQSANLEGLLGISAATYAVLAILAIVVPILFTVLTLVGRYKAFKAIGIDGWRGAVPCYAWYALGEGLGDSKGLGLAVAILSGVQLIIPFVWIALVICQFILLRRPGKEGGLSTGLTIGVILLPFIFWFVVAGKYKTEEQ